MDKTGIAGGGRDDGKGGGAMKALKTDGGTDEAITVICGYIAEYEEGKDPNAPFPAFDKDRYENVTLPAMIAAGVTVLSAVTGRDYHWKRGKRGNGEYFSELAVCEGGGYKAVSGNLASSGVRPEAGQGD